MFPAAELQGWVDALCADPSGVECARPQLGWLSLELGGVGVIEVAPGQVATKKEDIGFYVGGGRRLASAQLPCVYI